MCSGSHVRLYGAFGHFGPPQGTDNWQRIADYRVRTDKIAWVLDNGGKTRYFGDNIHDTYNKYGLKPFVAGTSIIDYCRWPGYTADKNKNKCLDNYWLPDVWRPLPTKGQFGTERYFGETTNPLNYKTLSKTCNHLMAVYGDKAVNPDNLDLYPSSESTQSGLGYMDAIEHINEPDATWLGWMWYMQPEECAAQLSAVYDGHCGTLADETGNKAKYGVKNMNPNAVVLMPGMAGLNVGYVKNMYIWSKRNRPDGKFPCDVLNFHSYFSNIGNQEGDTTTAVQYAITCEDSLKNNTGGAFLTMADFRDRYLPDKQIWLTEFGYGECGGRNTQSKYQCYTQPGRQIGSWVIPDRHRSDVKGAWSIRAVLTMMRLGFDGCNYYSTEMESSYFDASVWGSGAGFEMFHWNDTTDPTPGAKAAAIQQYEHSYPRGGFASTGLFGPILACGGFPISRAYWWIATYRHRLKGYVFTGMKYLNQDSRIMIFCFRKLNEDKGAYVAYFNDSQNTGVANVEIPMPSGLTTVTKVTVYVPELVSPEAIPSNWVEYDQCRTQLPTSRREKFIDGAWVIQNPKWAGQYESFSQAAANYPTDPQEGDEVTVIPTNEENPYFPIVGPVMAKYSIHGNNPSAQEYEWIDPADPVNADGSTKWSTKYNNALAWRQVDAVCDYIDYTSEGQHGISGDETVIEVLRDSITVNISEFPDIYLFDAIPDPDFKSKITDLTAIPINSNSVKLYWNNYNPNDEGYELFVSDLPESGYSKLRDIAIGAENMFIVSGLMENTTYYFKVRAKYADKFGDFSDSASATTYSFLPTPENVRLDANTASAISIAWDYTSELLADFVKYSVYRSNGDGNFSIVGEINDYAIHAFTDVNLTIGKTYIYKVRAVGLNGQSAYSTELSTRTLTAEECPPTIRSIMTDKLGTKVIIAFDLQLQVFDPTVRDNFLLTEDYNAKVIKTAYLDPADSRNLILSINQDSLSDYDKNVDIRLTYNKLTSVIQSIYGIGVESFSNRKVSNLIGNFTNIEATYKLNLTGDDAALPITDDWNNIIGNPEQASISSSLKDTYGRLTTIVATSIHSSPALMWGASSKYGSGSIPNIDQEAILSGWNVAYRAFVDEAILARLQLSGLNPEHRYTIKAYSGYNNPNAAPASARLKINNTYSVAVTTTPASNSLMVIEDCIPSADGILNIDCIPMRETTGTPVQISFFLIEEYKSSSEPANTDVFLREVTVLEDNSEGVVFTNNVHLSLNCIGIPTHYRIAENSEEALLLEDWIAIDNINSIPILLSANFGPKTLFVQVKNAFNESNVRSIGIEYRDPYMPLALTNIFINNDDSVTFDVNVSVFIEKQGVPTHYRIAETSDLSTLPWIEFPSPIENSVPFELSNTSGQKTVYMQLKDATTETAIKVDTIELNVDVALQSVVIENRTDAVLTISTTYSGMPTHYRIAENSEDIATSEWLPFTSSIEYTYSTLTDGIHYIYLQLKNSYDNVSSIVSQFFSISSNTYVAFEDSVVGELVANTWGDGVGVKMDQITPVQNFKGLFTGNTGITSFNEFAYFISYNATSWDVFSGCTALAAVTLPPQLKTLYGFFFSNCSALTSLNLENIEVLQKNALSNVGLSEIILPNYVSAVSDSIMNCQNLTKLVLGNNGTIPTSFGNACPALTYIDLGSGINIIDNCFKDSPLLSDIIVRSLTPPKFNNSFVHRSASCKIYVPDESVDAYKAAAGWIALASLINPLSTLVPA